MGVTLRRRTVLRGLAGGALAAPLAACSRLSGNSGDGDKVVRWAQFYTTQSGAAAEANKRWLRKVKAAFEKENAGWSVQFEGYPWDQIDQRMVLDLRGGVPHDVTMTSPQLMAEHAEAGSLLDLTKHVARWSARERGDLSWSTVWKSAHIGGKQLGVPLGVSTRALAVNQRHYHAAGLDPADVTTLDDLVSAAKTLNRRGAGGLAIYLGSDRATTELSFAPLVWNFGGSFFDEQKKEATLTSSASIRAARWLQDAAHRWRIVPEFAYAPTAANDDVLMSHFVDGRAAHSFCYGCYWVQALETAHLISGCYPPKAGCAPSGATIEPLPTHGNAAFTNGWLASIGAKSKRPDMAWKLIEVMIRPENLRAYPDAGLPARESEYARHEYSSNFYRTWFDVAKHGRGMPSTRYYNQLSDTVAAALQEIVGKRGDVESTLRRFEDEWNRKYAGK